jgi:hypothetical protein
MVSEHNAIRPHADRLEKGEGVLLQNALSAVLYSYSTRRLRFKGHDDTGAQVELGTETSQEAVKSAFTTDELLCDALLYGCWHHSRSDDLCDFSQSSTDTSGRSSHVQVSGILNTLFNLSQGLVMID